MVKQTSPEGFYRTWLTLIDMRIEKTSDAIKLGDDLFTNQQTIEVVQGGWRVSSSDLSTIGVESCLALAAHNEVTRRGLLGHFSTISHEAQLNHQLAEEQFDTAVFDEALAHLPDLGPTRATDIWLGGAALQTESSLLINNGILLDRRYGEEKVAEATRRFSYKDNAVKFDWSMPGRELHIRLDCVAGRLLIQPIEEYA